MDEIATRLGSTRNQVALTWFLHNDRLRENSQASDWKLSQQDYEKLSEAFA